MTMLTSRLREASAPPRPRRAAMYAAFGGGTLFGSALTLLLVRLLPALSLPPTSGTTRRLAAAVPPPPPSPCGLGPYRPRGVWTGTAADDPDASSAARIAEYTRAYRTGSLGLLSYAEWDAQQREARELLAARLNASRVAGRRGSGPALSASTGTAQGTGALSPTAALFEFDRARYDAYAPTTPPPVHLQTPAMLRAWLRRWQHDIEKGLSMPDMKLGFGVRSGALDKMQTAAGALLARAGSSTGKLRRTDVAVLLSVRDALTSYAHAHKARGAAVPPKAAKLLRSWERRAQDWGSEAFASAFPPGGARRVRREDVHRAVGRLPPLPPDADAGAGASGGSGDGSGGESALPSAGVDLAPFFASRHSIRQFDAHAPVEPGLIVEAVRRAIEASPSVCNRQGARVYYLSSAAARAAALRHQSGNRGFGHTAPVVLVLAASVEHYMLMPTERYQGWIDGGMFAQSVLLALHSVGLGACPLNWDVPPQRDRDLRREVGIPEGDLITMLVAVGHLPAELDVATSPRKPLREVLFPEAAVWPVVQPAPTAGGSAEASPTLVEAAVAEAPAAARAALAAPRAAGSAPGDNIGGMCAAPPPAANSSASAGTRALARASSAAGLPPVPMPPDPPPGGALCARGALGIGLPTVWDGPWFSVGDHAVVWALAQELRARCPRAELLCWRCDIKRGSLTPPLPLGLRTVGPPASSSRAVPAAQWRTIGALFILATDVIDGRYDSAREPRWRAWAREAATHGVPFTVVAFSYTPVPGRAQLIGHYPSSACLRPRAISSCAVVADLTRRAARAECGACDSASPAAPAAAAARALVAPRASARARVRHVFDMAFLIRPDPRGPPPADAAWLADARAAASARGAGRGAVLGVNLYLYDAAAAAAELPALAALFASELCAAASTLSARPDGEGVSYLLLAHDQRPFRMPAPRTRGGRGYASESHYLADVRAHLARRCPRVRVRLFCRGAHYEPIQSSALLGHLDGVLSGFMHLLVLCAARGTPGLALASQAKFVELAADLYGAGRAEEHLIRNFTTPGALRAALVRFVRALPAMRAQLSSRLPAVYELARRNLDVFDPDSGPDSSEGGASEDSRAGGGARGAGIAGLIAARQCVAGVEPECLAAPPAPRVGRALLDALLQSARHRRTTTQHSRFSRRALAAPPDDAPHQ